MFICDADFFFELLSSFCSSRPADYVATSHALSLRETGFAPPILKLSAFEFVLLGCCVGHFMAPCAEVILCAPSAQRISPSLTSCTMRC